jgi:translation elongation factor EF-G
MISRLKRRLDQSRIADIEPNAEKDDHKFNFDTHIETGFQLATFQGPLCAEPVEGLAYFVENLEFDEEGLEKEIGALYICQRFDYLVDMLNSTEPDGRSDGIDHHRC